MPKSQSGRKRRSLAEIATLMDEFKGANLPMSEIARRIGVSVPTLYQWRRRLEQDRNATGASPSSGMVRVFATNCPSTTVVGSSRFSAGISLILASGVVCQVEADFDEQTLLRVVNLLAPTSN